MNHSSTVLEVQNLSVELASSDGVIRAVAGLSFAVRPGQTLGIVGESGCGKSVTSLAIMGLLPKPAGRIASGRIRLDNYELTALPETELRRLRGAELSMIFQEPMTALNPVYSIAQQMTSVLRRHQKLSAKQARSEAIDMLARVGIPLPDQRIDDYPHQLSGGMRQRVMIAMALSCRPKLLIADEPTTALDVTTQAQVLQQISDLQTEFGTAVMLITHDLGVIAETCDEAVVMYCGSKVEQAPVDDLFRRPQHPYTAGLLQSIPRIREQKLARLPVIEGQVPDLADLPTGCRFAARCPNRLERCEREQPEVTISGPSTVSCFNPHTVRAAP
ncbi:MAG: ABC transporter ATP-binding protein [Pseudomonadota bacterium]